MKKIICLLTLSFICQNNVFPGGGVSVGNGQGNAFVGLNLTDSFGTQEDLDAAVRILAKEINANANDKINKFKRMGKCDQDYSQVKAIDFNEFLPIKDGMILSGVDHVGHIRVEVKKCKTISKIVAEEPLNGSDLWDLEPLDN